MKTELTMGTLIERINDKIKEAEYSFNSTILKIKLDSEDTATNAIEYIDFFNWNAKDGIERANVVKQLHRTKKLYETFEERGYEIKETYSELCNYFFEQITREYNVRSNSTNELNNINSTAEYTAMLTVYNFLTKLK